jgi:hypothetical protein
MAAFQCQQCQCRLVLQQRDEHGMLGSGAAPLTKLDESFMLLGGGGGGEGGAGASESGACPLMPA